VESKFSAKPEGKVKRKILELKLPGKIVEELEKKAEELGLKSASALLKVLSLNPEVYCPLLPEIEEWGEGRESLYLSYTPEEKERAKENAERLGLRSVQELIRFLLLMRKNAKLFKEIQK